MSKTNPRWEDDFDPYYKWLGIPEKLRPPTFYQLLGIATDEQNAEVISAAADRQKGYVTQFREGPFAEQAASVIYQLDEALAVLLNPAARVEYDAKLGILSRRQSFRAAPATPLSVRDASPSYTAGEESGLSRQFFGIVATLLVAIIVMAVVSFNLPWSKFFKQENSSGEGKFVAGEPKMVLPPLQPDARKMPPTATPAEKIPATPPVTKEVDVARKKAADDHSDLMETIYRSMKIVNARIVGGPFKTGEEVRIAYELKNMGRESLTVPLDLTFSKPYHLVGTRQHWIERLGGDSTIPNIPAVIGRSGAKYAAGGTIIFARPTLAPAESLSFEERLSTAGHPPGKYKYSIEYKKVPGGVIETVDVPFELLNNADAGAGKPKAAESPKAAAPDALETVYRSMKIVNVRVVGGPFKVGDEVRVLYELKNATRAGLTVPLNRSYSQPYYLIGTRQHWIERLGEDSTIPAIPSQIARNGKKYAAGGTIIPAKATLLPGESVRFEERISTVGFPAGEYRYFIEYEKAATNLVIQSADVKFALRHKGA